MKPIVSATVTPLLLLLVSISHAQSTAKLLPFQGHLTGGDGKAVADGTKLIQFRIYDQPVAGDVAWAGEVHRTTVNGGLVNVILGTKASLTEVNFDRTLYLEITVDANDDKAITAADPPLLPGQVLLPVVFAKEAAVARDSQKLAGFDWGSLLSANEPVNGKLHGSKIATESITSAQIADAGINTGRLQDGAVTTAKLAEASILTSTLADRAVSSGKIADEAVLLNNLAREVLRRLVPAGTIAAFAGEAGQVPDGWLLCDGSPIARDAYPELFNLLGENWGTDGTGRRRLPDLRGVFLRGVNGSRSDAFADPGDNRSGGNKVGSYQSDALAQHTHNVPAGHWPGDVNGQHFFPVIGGFIKFTPTESQGGSIETRPKNAYVNYIIRH